MRLPMGIERINRRSKGYFRPFLRSFVQGGAQGTFMIFSNFSASSKGAIFYGRYLPQGEEMYPLVGPRDCSIKQC